MRVGSFEGRRPMKIAWVAALALTACGSRGATTETETAAPPSVAAPATTAVPKVMMADEAEEIARPFIPAGQELAHPVLLGRLGPADETLLVLTAETYGK